MIDNGSNGNGHDEEDEINGFLILEEIWDGTFDLHRPTSCILPELVEAIKALDCRITDAEDEKEKEEA